MINLQTNYFPKKIYLTQSASLSTVFLNKLNPLTMAVIAVTAAGGSVVYIIASVGRCGGHSLTETTCARTQFPVLKALLLLIFTPLNTIIVNFAQPLLLLFFCLFWISLAALAAVLLIHVEITVSLLYHPWTIGPQVRTPH